MTQPSGKVLPLPTRARPHGPTAHEINVERMRTASRAAWLDGYQAGLREAFDRARKTWLVPGLSLGFALGALARHAAALL